MNTARAAKDLDAVSAVIESLLDPPVIVTPLMLWSPVPWVAAYASLSPTMICVNLLH
jgi:hypothetical protein